MTAARVTTTISASGEGYPTAGDLLRVLEQFPPDARVTFRQSDNQRDGAYWSMEAQVKR